MIEQEPLCDDQELLRMLRRDSDSRDSVEILDHVESCQSCQQRLDELAANEAELQKTVDALSSNAHSVGSDGLYSSSQMSCFHLHQPAWTESMARQLLSPPAHPEMHGRIGRYDVERLIGSGGMGVVFKAYDTELNRPVAVKLLAPYLASSGAARHRFAREARAAAAVVDDHVVPIHNVETDDEHPFLVMQYIAGGSLQHRLDREGPLEVCEVLRIGMQMAKALAAAHAQGLIHRDVKPSNILLDEGVDRALLTDFGLASATDDASLTRSGFHPGTPHYMSPEQVRGEAIDARSDLFGLGCVLYALCTGHPPFRSETSYAVLHRITDDTPRPIRASNSGIPAWLEQFVMKLLAKSPEDRFDSAEQVAGLLEDCLAHVQQPTTTSLPESICASSAPQQNLRPPIGKYISAAALAFSLIFAGVLVVLELNKGTLTIESETDDVPIRIMQGDKIVDKMIVSKGDKSVRIASGTYVVEIDGEFDGVDVKDGRVTLERRGTKVVQILQDGKNSSGHDEACPFCTAEKPTIRQELERNTSWSLGQPRKSNELDRYVDAIRSLSDSPAKRFKFFWRHLEDGNNLIAEDANKEISLAHHEQLVRNDGEFKLKQHIDRKQLVVWIEDGQVPADRKRIYLRLLGYCGNARDAHLLEQMLRDRNPNDSIYLDAVIASYVSLCGPEALDLVDELLLQAANVAETDLYAVILAVRFLNTHGDDIGRDRLLQSLHLVLQHPSVADLVVPLLIQLEDWSQIGTLVDLLKSADEESKWVRIPVIQYLQTCPLPEAAAELRNLREMAKALERAPQQKK